MAKEEDDRARCQSFARSLHANMTANITRFVWADNSHGPAVSTLQRDLHFLQYWILREPRIIDSLDYSKKMRKRSKFQRVAEKLLDSVQAGW